MSTPSSVTPVGYGLELSGWAADFVPDFTAEGVAGLDFAEIRGHMGLEDGQPLHGIFDLDRTLRGMSHDKIASEIVDNLGAQLADGTLTSATIASNSRSDIAHFGPQLGEDVRVFTRRDMGAIKPSLKFFEHIVGVRGIRGDAMVMVGDMCLRDVLFAHRARQAGMQVVSVLVEPLAGRDHGGDYLLGRHADRAALWAGRQALRRTRGRG